MNLPNIATKSSQRYTKSRKTGFTLTELLVGMSLAVLVAGSATWFMMEGARVSLKTTNASINDSSQWGILTAITVDSKVANGMAMYKTLTAPDLTDSTKQLNKDERGNAMILTKSEQIAGSQIAVYKKITGYIFSNSSKTLKKFEYTVKSTEESQPLETILTNNLGNFKFTTVANDVVTVDSGGAFLMRSKGKSGVMTIQSTTGTGKNQSKKLIEASFFIRG